MENSQEYWEKQFSSFCEIQMKLAQANFFYNTFATLLSNEFINLLNSECKSCCDFGCGLGNFTDKLHNVFHNMQIYGVDYSFNAIKYATSHFKNTDFLNLDYRQMQSNFDIIVTSNTLEHFSDPKSVINRLLQHTNKYFVMLVPYEEYPLYKEHYFSFNRDFFCDEIENFELIYLKSVDLRYKFNTMWFGKQILAIYKHKTECANISKDVNLDENDNHAFIEKCNCKINLLRRDTYRFIRSKILNKEG